ncbi:hypothetical protein ACJMK2_039189 [Sinanodonta woodiana]|uniref:Uncharacterized protein n=1 Tax=Sinanodonta woodiana TaxID=1069815 RepID=A0ABD3WCP3_SINWO
MMGTSVPLVLGLKCVFGCSIGFVKELPGCSLHCQPKVLLESLFTASPSILVASKRKVNQAALGAGVGIGVTVVVVITVVSVFFILRRRKFKSAFVPKRMQEDVMTATFRPDNDFPLVSYDNYAVHVIDPKIPEEPQILTPHSINTGREASRAYDESMAIPRPRAIEKPPTNLLHI